MLAQSIVIVLILTSDSTNALHKSLDNDDIVLVLQNKWRRRVSLRWKNGYVGMISPGYLDGIESDQ